MVAARRVDGSCPPEFDAWAMPQPSHIYASTLDRRDRRWSRRRPVWPAALTGVAALAGLGVLAIELLRGLG